jgi:hypothetical protein
MAENANRPFKTVGKEFPSFLNAPLWLQLKFLHYFYGCEKTQRTL